MPANLMSLGGLTIAIGYDGGPYGGGGGKYLSSSGSSRRTGAIEVAILLLKAVAEVGTPVIFGIHRYPRVPAADDATGDGGQDVQPARLHHRHLRCWWR